MAIVQLLSPHCSTTNHWYNLSMFIHLLFFSFSLFILCMVHNAPCMCDRYVECIEYILWSTCHEVKISLQTCIFVILLLSLLRRSLRGHKTSDFKMSGKTDKDIDHNSQSCTWTYHHTTTTFWIFYITTTLLVASSQSKVNHAFCQKLISFESA